jgi:phage tail tube protein FII
MKQHKLNYRILFLLLLLAGYSDAQQDSVTRDLLLSISYNLPADNVPFLKITAREKVERKFIPQKNINGAVYIGEESESGLLGKIKTDDKGEAIVYISSAFKSRWDSLSPLKFLAVTEANKIFAATTSETEIYKSKIEIDTASTEEAKNIMVKITELKNGEWLPAKDMEVKVAIKRSLGNLSVGEEESYTTDSTGMITAEFKRDSISGDSKGNIILVARTEDNETLGNIFAEKTVNWGKASVIKNIFNERSLWATRFKTPYWLLVLAYSIIGIVWGSLVYIIVQIIKIRKLGRTVS